MKTKLTLALIMLALFAGIHQVFAQGTAFTYQGRLQNNSTPANGSYDLQFVLFTTNQFGSPATPVLTNAAVTVNNGLFTTTLDFGTGVFTGSNYWLDISVRTNGNGTFNELSPRQPVTPAPYAITAETVNNLPGLTVQQNTSGAPNLIGGSPNNFVATGVIGATIAGGGATNASGFFPPSETNSVTADFGTVSGGARNAASGQFATVGGGDENTASGAAATISGGGENTASGAAATISGGEENVASINEATVGGGVLNTASGIEATVPGGKNNLASGQCSFAAGQNAHATNDNSFVWCDGNPIPITSIANASVTFNASGGYRFFTGAGAGAQLPANGTSWTTISDRNAKKNFQAVDTVALLAKLATIPVQQWNYKWEKDTDVPNIGPMAQDFKHAFYPGRDDKGISTLEFDGVELAAIQGLNQKLDEKDSEIQTLKQQNDSLAERLNELEATVKQFTTQK